MVPAPVPRHTQACQAYQLRRCQADQLQRPLRAPRQPNLPEAPQRCHVPRGASVAQTPFAPRQQLRLRLVRRLAERGTQLARGPQSAGGQQRPLGHVSPTRRSCYQQLVRLRPPRQVLRQQLHQPQQRQQWPGTWLQAPPEPERSQSRPRRKRHQELVALPHHVVEQPATSRASHGCPVSACCRKRPLGSFPGTARRNRRFLAVVLLGL